MFDYKDIFVYFWYCWCPNVKSVSWIKQNQLRTTVYSFIEAFYKDAKMIKGFSDTQIFFYVSIIQMCKEPWINSVSRPFWSGKNSIKGNKFRYWQQHLGRLKSETAPSHTHTIKHPRAHTLGCAFLIEASKGQLGWPMLLQSVISVFDQRATGIWPPRPDRQAAVNTGSWL